MLMIKLMTVIKQRKRIDLTGTVIHTVSAALRQLLLITCLKDSAIGGAILFYH